MSALHQRLNKALLIAITAASMSLASCSMPQVDPTSKTIPTDSDQWQQNLGATFENLPKSDQQLLSR
ncbi:MAG: hypothetical protein L0J53_09425, partial [Psychrobacter sp.]|nr:hypothetical protein [Psychrobacter sp.]